MFFCKDLFRSLARHSRKGLLALAVAVGLSAMLFLFAGAVASYQGELDRLEEDYDLTLTFTNVAGTSTKNLIIYDDRLQTIEESGLAEPGFYRATSFFSDGTEDDAAFLELVGADCRGLYRRLPLRGGGRGRGHLL